MKFIFNELSLHDQFTDIVVLQHSMQSLLGIRAALKGRGHELYCCHGASSRSAFLGQSLTKIANQLERDTRGLLLGWLDRAGPYWEESQVHDSDCWYARGDTLVTETGVAECLCLNLQGTQSSCVSIDPSDWCVTPLSLTREFADDIHEVLNYWTADDVEHHLSASAAEPKSWIELIDSLDVKYLRIFENAFNPLFRTPFNAPQSNMIRRQILILDKLSCAIISGDKVTQDELKAEHFSGERAWFTDSSVSEKAKFKDQLTFFDAEAKSYISGTWHGKISHGVFRLHFSNPWGQLPICLCYVGPKITKQ